MKHPPTGPRRRSVLRAAAATAAGLGFGAARAQTAGSYPSRPIRVIIPFVPGGSGDTVVRAIGIKLTESWGQPVVVENRAGAAGALGLQIAAKSPPDGYTLVLGTSGTHAIAPNLQANLGYDAAKDFVPVAMMITVPNVLVAHPSLPAGNLRELIALARSTPGRLSYASNGNGTPSHLSGELLNAQAHIKLLHVPYKGAGQAINDVLGGHVPLLFGALSTSLPHITSGRLNALGVTTAQRSPAAPTIPTFAESGLPGFDVGQWFGLFAPARTPADLVAKLNSEINRALLQPDVKAEFTRLGFDPLTRNPAEFAAVMKAETAQFAQVIKEAGIRAE